MPIYPIDGQVPEFPELEVVRLGIRSGIPAEIVDQVLSNSSADSFMWRYQVPRMVTGNFVPGVSVDAGRKDLGSQPIGPTISA